MEQSFTAHMPLLMALAHLNYGKDAKVLIGTVSVPCINDLTIYYLNGVSNVDIFVINMCSRVECFM